MTSEKRACARFVGESNSGAIFTVSVNRELVPGPNFAAAKFESRAIPLGSGQKFSAITSFEKKLVFHSASDRLAPEKIEKVFMKMILRGIPFEPVFKASGATNFDNKGYWYHKPLSPLGLRWDGATFVSKTTTLLPRAGNMPLKKDGITPKELLPRCIIVNWREKAVLNAVSLSGPGIRSLIKSKSRMWQNQTEPFFISVMSLAKTPEERKAELREIFIILQIAYREEDFKTRWGVQINFSCPNGGVDPNDLVEEAVPILEMANEILPSTVPVMPKFGPEVHPRSMLRICLEPSCDAISVFNTLPFGKYPSWAKESPPVDWKGIFGTDDPKESPMAKRFPGFAGGYSGKALLPFLLEWLYQVRKLGITKPICAGGGILSPAGAVAVLDAGADCISIGSMALLAPTQLHKTILKAHAYTRNFRKAPEIALAKQVV